MDSGPFSSGAIVQRALTLMIAGQIAMAAIVIGFVSNTWSYVSKDFQHLAFVVVCGSGAHFVMSLVTGGLIASYFQFRQNILSTTIAISSSAVYIYCSLIIQHSGLAQMLLERPWVSVFPFGDFMIGLLQGEQREVAYYTLPFVMACLVAFVCYFFHLCFTFFRQGRQ
jgi:hypothetical protein